MEGIFIKVLNLSVSAGWLILAVIALRLLLKKAPRWITVLLWGITGLRLVMPFSIRTRLSLIPSAQTVSPSIAYEQHPSIHSGVSVIDNAVNPALGSSLAADPASSANPMQIWLFAGSIIWLAGIAVMLLYSVFCWLRLRGSLAEAVSYRDEIWLCDHVKSPFILGVIHPRIYLPSGLCRNDAANVLAHERAHIERLDHIWKPLGFLLLSVYWFSPLVWIAYILLCRDIETACDEKVITGMDMAGKKAYANALVSCSERQRINIACPLAFGEVGVKERVKEVLNFKRPVMWIIIISLLLCAAAVVFFMTDPPKKEEDTMTYEDVIRLSEKGEALGWSDFDGYEYDEIGSGLYIRSYKIDDMFSVYVGGGYSPDDTENKPMYVYLKANNMAEDTIDIRYDDARQFIETHKNDPIARHISASWDSCAVAFNDNGFSAMINAGAYDAPFYLSSVRYLPIIKISDRKQLDDFRGSMNGVMSFDEAFLDGKRFDDLAARYNDSFFKKNELLLVYVSAGNTGPRFSIDFVKVCENKLTVGLVEDDRYTSADDSVVAWLVAVEVPKKELAEIEICEALVSSVQDDKPEPVVTEVTDLTAVNGLIEAKIVGNGHEFALNDPEKLSRLESMFKNASIEMPSGCPFDECYLSLTMQDGETWVVYPATDGCGIIKTSSDVFYRYSYGDDEVKDGNNELFWELFGIDIKDLRDIFG